MGLARVDVATLGRRVGRSIAIGGALSATALTAHTVYNLARVRRPPVPGEPVAETVSVLLPVRDEAHRVVPTLRSLLAQREVPGLEILVLDDGSTDGTAQVVRDVVGADPRVRLLEGGADPPPPGWLGKPWACSRLAQAASGSALVFVDADVVLAPTAVAGTVRLLRESGLQLVSPYPRQLAVTAAERLLQPLLVWSWLTTLALGPAERSGRPSLSAANGQLLAVDAAAYRASGGHGAVRGLVLEDIGLLRALKRNGFRGIPADGSAVAECRMYDGMAEVVDGYTKSLWSAFGGAPGAIAVVALLLGTYVAPPALGLVARDRRTVAAGAVAYAAGVTGRVLVARRTGGRAWPDALAHPFAVAAFAALTAESFRRRRAGSLTWKGRRLP